MHTVANSAGGPLAQTPASRHGGRVTEPLFIDRGDGVRLAFAHLPGSAPTLVFLPGYMSDMQGTKAVALEAFARGTGRACLEERSR